MKLRLLGAPWGTLKSAALRRGVSGINDWQSCAERHAGIGCANEAAVKRAAKTIRGLRVAEVAQLDITMKDGKVEAYRAKVKVSFKYEGGS